MNISQSVSGTFPDPFDDVLSNQNKYLDINKIRIRSASDEFYKLNKRKGRETQCSLVHAGRENLWLFSERKFLTFDPIYCMRALREISGTY